MLAAAVVAGVVYVRRHKVAVPAPTALAVPTAGSSSAAASAPAASVGMHYPVTDALATTGTAPPPPGLGVSDGSDASVRAALQALAGGNSLDGLLVPDFMIQHIVAAIDALPNKQLPATLLPVRGAAGSLVTTETGGALTLDMANANRYAPYMRLVDGVDARQLVAWYVRNYALFQQAYRQLGHADGDFNDRLVTVIDHLLAAPVPTLPVELTQPKVRYAFADPTLESLSAGQKMLVRAGPVNEARIKAKLRAIRAALTGVHPVTSATTN